MKSEAVDLICKMYSKPGTNRKLAQDYVDDTSLFLSNVINAAEGRIRTRLSSHGIDDSVIDDVCADLADLKEPFAEFDTEHKQLEYLKKEGYYIPLVDYNVAPDM